LTLATMPLNLWVLATGAFAAGHVAWLVALDRVIDPSMRRIIGRLLRVRVESAESRAGPFSVRAWSVAPPDFNKRALVAVSGALIVLLTAALPTILIFVLVANLPLSPRVSATLTLMAMLTYPIIVAARLLSIRGD
jgi:hypothetical protein